MEIIEWTDGSQLDMPAIDDEHRQLAELINRLYRAIHVRQPLGTLRPFLAELEAYANAHFEGEEQLMRRHQRPAHEIEMHAAEHDEFRACLRSLAQDIEVGEISLRLDLWQFVTSWWNNHVLGTDRRMARAFQGDVL